VFNENKKFSQGAKINGLLHCHLPEGRGLHSSTFRLNVSAFCGQGVHLGVAQGVFRRWYGVLGGAQGVFWVRNGSS